MGMLIWDLRLRAPDAAQIPRVHCRSRAHSRSWRGATQAVFTLIHQVMLRSLPVAQPGQLWLIGGSDRCCFSNGYSQGSGDGESQNSWSFLFVGCLQAFFAANTPAFEELAAFQVGSALLGVRPQGSAGGVMTANGEFVSANFFKTFGVTASRGRLRTTMTGKARRRSPSSVFMRGRRNTARPRPWSEGSTRSTASRSR